MDKRYIKQKAYKLRQTTDKSGFGAAKAIAQRLGYTVVVSQEPTRLSAGVLPEQRVIFLPASVTEDYAAQLLAHEIGHIALAHQKIFAGDNARAEAEADYFARYLLQPPAIRKLKQAAIALLVLLGLAICYLTYIQPVTTTIYVTPSGSRYHTEDCRYVKNKDAAALSMKAAEEEGYTACKVCTLKD